MAKGYGKVHPCTVTEALYRPILAINQLNAQNLAIQHWKCLFLL